MKKNMKFIISGFLFGCLIVCLLIINILMGGTEEKKCNNFGLETLVNEINLATNNKFTNVLNDDMSMYVPVAFSTETNYIFSHSDEIGSDYFIIAQSLNESELFDLESFIKTHNRLYADKQIKIETHGEYTYAIFSEKYVSIIEGIIRNYIYCN